MGFSCAAWALGCVGGRGSCLRGTSNSRKKRELVILATPKIVNDELGGTYGYGYQPDSRDARQLLGGQGG